VKAAPVDSLLFDRLAQRDTEEGPDVNPVPKGAGIRQECQQICEEIVGKILLNFLLQVFIPRTHMEGVKIFSRIRVGLMKKKPKR